MFRSLKTSSSAQEKITTDGIKVLAFASIGYLACKYIVTSVTPTSGIIFSTAATIVDIVSSKYINANKNDKAMISSLVSIIAATSATKYFAKITIIQALKISLCLTISQLALATLGLGIMMGSFAELSRIVFKKIT